MNFTFLANINTPQSIINALETYRTNEFYNVPYSMTFNQITVKFRHQNTQLHIAHDLIKKQMHWLNEDFFQDWVGKNRRLSKDIETGIAFAVIGFAEIKNGNFHVHLLMRVPNGAVILLFDKRPTHFETTSRVPLCRYAGRRIDMSNRANQICSHI